MNAVEGVDVPFFLFEEVGSKIFVGTMKEKVDGKFAGVGFVVDEQVGGGGRKDWWCSGWTTSVAGVSEGAGGITHFVDSHWWGGIL